MATAKGVWLLGLIFGIGVSARLFAKASSTKISCLMLVKENNKYTKFHEKNMIRWFSIKLIFFFFFWFIYRIIYYKLISNRWALVFDIFSQV